MAVKALLARSNSKKDSVLKWRTSPFSTVLSSHSPGEKNNNKIHYPGKRPQTVWGGKRILILHFNCHDDDDDDHGDDDDDDDDDVVDFVEDEDADGRKTRMWMLRRGER